MNQRPRTHTMGAGGRDVLLQCLQHDDHHTHVGVRGRCLFQTAPFVVSGAPFAPRASLSITEPGSLPGKIERTTDAHVGTKCRI